MNQTHVVAGAAGVSIYPSLNLILTWLLTWPIVPPTPDTVSAISAVIVSGVLLGASMFVRKAGPSLSDAPTTPAIPPAA
ncbi:MAG: hypothetical protein JWO51_129 [Rhodospirillales bacterium]|nr:hypothetical protein [Rhodospirillales bacterium]